MPYCQSYSYSNSSSVNASPQCLGTWCFFKIGLPLSKPLRQSLASLNGFFLIRVLAHYLRCSFFWPSVPKPPHPKWCKPSMFCIFCLVVAALLMVDKWCRSSCWYPIRLMLLFREYDTNQFSVKHDIWLHSILKFD